MPEEKDERREGKGYRGDSSGGYGTGGAAADFEEMTGRNDVSPEEVFPEEAERGGETQPPASRPR